MGKRMILRVEELSREETTPLSLTERYQRRKEAERAMEEPLKNMKMHSIEKDIQGLKDRMLTDPIYQQNLEKRRQREKEKQVLPTYEHRTTKRKPVVEARGTIINAMCAPPPVAKNPSRGELAVKGWEDQLAERSAQARVNLPVKRLVTTDRDTAKTHRPPALHTTEEGHRVVYDHEAVLGPTKDSTLPHTARDRVLASQEANRTSGKKHPTKPPETARVAAPHHESPRGPHRPKPQSAWRAGESFGGSGSRKLFTSVGALPQIPASPRRG